jgi:hypothetical protein
MIRLKRNKIARIKALWSTAYGRGWKKSMDFWRIQAAKEIEILRREYEERISLERTRHIEEEQRIRAELVALQAKFRAHRDNINRVQNVSNALISVVSELKMSVAGAFQRASTATHEIDMAVMQDRKLIKKYGEEL